MADVELVRHQADVAQQLHRRHLVLADDVEHLVDIVGGVDRDRQIALPRRLGRLAHQGDGAGLDFARHQDAADAVAMGALVALDEFERQTEFPLARGFVHHAYELASFTADPAAAVEARTEISPDAELADGLEQRLLDAQLASELDECGDAVAQQLGHRELGIERAVLRRPSYRRGGRSADRRRRVCRLARHADFKEGLAEIVAASDVGDQPVRGAVARMHMGVDESRRHQLVAGVDLVVDGAFEAFADEKHGIAFIDQLGVTPKGMLPACICNQPAAGDAGTHGIPPRARSTKRRHGRRAWKQAAPRPGNPDTRRLPDIAYPFTADQNR